MNRMKILLVTPLYPPDIADPAPYAKELASRLKKNHTVTILAYNHIPEPIEGVEIITVEKNRILPLRLMNMFFKLYKAAKHHDVIYLQNGPSTELPAVLITLLVSIPIVLRLGDEAALRFAQRRRLLRLVQRLAIKRMHANIVHDNEVLKDVIKICRTDCAHLCKRPLSRPEILPFSEYPKDAFIDFDMSWEEHIDFLMKHFAV